MALQTMTKSMAGWSNNHGLWIQNLFSGTNFGFDSLGSNIYGKYTNADQTNHIAINANGTPYLYSVIDETESTHYPCNHAVFGVRSLVSLAWDEDFFTAYATKDTGFPSGMTDAEALYGLWFVKAAAEDGSDTWVAGFTHNTGVNEWPLFGIDGYTHLRSDPMRTIRTTLANGIVITTPCTGIGRIYPEKVSIITATPENLYSSNGWVTVGGRSYYKNGIFLIDAEK